AEKRMVDTQWAFLKKDQTKGESYLESLLKHFLSNVQMNITNVHIRYQDFTTVPYHPFAFGVTLGRLTVINLTGKDDFDKQAEKADDNADEEEEEEEKEEGEGEGEGEEDEQKSIDTKDNADDKRSVHDLDQESSEENSFLFFTFVYFKKKKKKKKKI
ncbi:hypothetical protein RFI_34694, partial [Reticulomyxa filosa]